MRLMFVIVAYILVNILVSSNVSAESIYQYDSNNQLEQVVVKKGNDYFKTTIQYDGNGNITSKKTNRINKIDAPAEVDISAASYEVYAYGVRSDAKEVTFPSWSAADGQDDLEQPYVKGFKVSDGVWKSIVPLSKHNYHTGIYYNDVYIDGKYVGGATTTVTNQVKRLEYFSQVKIAEGYYEMSIYGIADNVVRVLFPTWTDRNGHDDIDWVEGQKMSNGDWKAKILFSKHHNEAGKYITHFYTYDTYGNKFNIGGITVTVLSR